MPTQPDVTIPVLGRPLAGKYTFVEHAVTGFGGRLHAATCPVSLAGQELEARLVRGTFAHAGRQVELWCMPGGSTPEWQATLASGALGAILVAEPQATVFDHQAKFFEAFAAPLRQWFVVVGKQDLAGLITPAREFLPPHLLSVPRLEYSGLARDAGASVRRFLSEVVLPTIAQSGYSLDAAVAASGQQR